jgi:hypothetical protein
VLLERAEELRRKAEFWEALGNDRAAMKCVSGGLALHGILARLL